MSSNDNGQSAPASQDNLESKPTDTVAAPTTADNIARWKGKTAPAAPVETAKPVEAVADVEATADAEAEHDGADEGDHDAQPAESNDGKSKRLPRWMEKRLARATEVARREAREEVLRDLERAGAAKGDPAAPKPEAPAVAAVEKTLKDFDFDEGAYRAHLVEEAKKEIRAKADAERIAREQTDAQEAFESELAEFVEREGEDAWHEIVTAPVKAPLHMLAMIRETGLGFDVSLALARDPALGNSIAKMTPFKMAQAIGEVASRFDTKAAPPAVRAQPPARVTRAPPPPRVVVGTGSVGHDPNTASTADNIARWKASRSSR